MSSQTSVAQNAKTKICSTCHVEKPIEEFYRADRFRDGKSYTCKSCFKVYYNRIKRRNTGVDLLSGPDKRCCRCGLVKARSSFFINRAASDGLTAYCKDCDKQKRLNRSTEEKERRKEYSHSHFVENRQRYLDHRHKRRALEAGGDFASADFSLVIERDGNRCYICGVEVDLTLRWPDPGAPSRDHVIPLSKGGSHTLDNVKLAHLACNWAKGTKEPN